MVKYQIDQGADIRVKNEENKTAMDISTDDGSTEIVNYLKNIFKIVYIKC